MSPKVAIIYSGEIRTMKSTINNFIKNCLYDSNHHVFAIIQTNEINILEDLKLMGDNLKDFINFEKNNSVFTNLKEKLVNSMELPKKWSDYLKYTSGSLIEYYQVWIASFSIFNYEKENKFQYDYIIRIRPDCMINSKMIFDDPLDNLLFKNRLLYKSLIVNFISTNLSSDSSSDYIITFRENIIYFMPRSAFTKIFTLGVTYGMRKTYNDGFWFNAESQLKSICINNNITIFDSSTISECKSLYEYDDSIATLDEVDFYLKRR